MTAVQEETTLAQPPALPSTQEQKTVGHVDNSVVIAAPLDLVWDMTNDVASWPDLFTEYASAEILSTEGDTVTFRLSMHPDANGTVWSWVSQRTPDRAARSVRAKRVETGPFEFMDIHWTYEEVPTGTRMRWVQDFAMKPTAPVDTAAMTTRINTNTPIQMEAIRGKVEAAAQAASTTSKVDDLPRVHAAQAPVVAEIKTVNATQVPANRRRGGDVRTVLAPSTCGSTTGFMGTVTLAPGDVVTEHWHPYSEEFLLVTQGSLTIRLDGEPRTLNAQDGVCVPIGVRHRLMNESSETAVAVFTLAPLAPQPRLGHVDTEATP